MSVPQVTSVTAVQHVTIQMDPTRASVTTATREMDEPVEVQARSRSKIIGFQQALKRHLRYK